MKPYRPPKSRVNTPPQTEAQVTKECVEFLHSIGWRPKRNHVGVFYTKNGTPVKIGERGESDWVFTHPKHPAFWLEMKGSGEIPRPEQMEFMAKLRHFGYLASSTDSLEFLQVCLREWGYLPKTFHINGYDL